MKVVQSGTRARKTRIAAVSAAVVALPLFFGGATAGADPVAETLQPIESVTSENGSKITRIENYGEQQLLVYVYSASMDKEILLDVWRPADTSEPRPTLYLLNGAGGGEDSATWRFRTDAIEFMKDKNVNVVSPVGGKWSYYTDWKEEDPVLGVNKWETFLTKEIPPLIDAALGTNGINAIAGLSSSGTSVLQLPIAAPGLYQGVAAYSGCAQTSDPIGQQFVKLVVETWGGGDTRNMWGELNDPAWAENDPYVHAEELRGLDLYISNGTGLPGRYDTLNGPEIDGQVDVLANQIVVGGVIEAATNYCTHNLRTRLDELDIPATYNFRDSGTHSWGYWQEDLKDSWPVLQKALGL
ncbi:MULTISPECIES: alpha/beta hydrolase [Rhodococcus]|uniref:alpha/beta hydrolase n=1 Tax=Rhodococcus TaxID=1827 RepID=UPI001E4CE181|nr:alpha/beta hydrolase family protein [Rhodococcus pyridinivorans]MCD2119455.1 esterase family protein [Rhodococcus pyridinivorans]MCZ4628359.1 alpha/beta hydrolase family protein [Rhodococcus pyridinivorans]MCZ4649593.1 alpha/beta hydrolase family protein [Rhodococcus pyridinivorans]MDJ0483748.1 alpha/beta hydrolase family protein [Rhodococcus pyridinivorans]MDV7253852.1 alpha/beta hydrolase family protein [Rhodococcus pyridinivorans]